MSEKNKIDAIFSMLIEAPEKKMRYELCELLFTPSELKQLKARYDIIKGLTAKDFTQRDLAAGLKLSIAKITRGSNELKRRSPALKKYLFNFFARNDAVVFKRKSNP